MTKLTSFFVTLSRFLFTTTAHEPLDQELVHPKQALTKEQAEVTSNVGDEGVKVIQPVLKTKVSIEIRNRQLFYLPMMYFLPVL